MTDYKPGTIAKATVRGQEDVLIVRDNDGEWAAPIPVYDRTWHSDEQVTDVRPLILLDLDRLPTTRSTTAVTAIRQAAFTLREQTVDGNILTAIADQIEAQTKPPRIPEPGLWGVVEAWTDDIPIRRWVHHEEDRWVCDTGERRNWEALSDPTLIREGVES